MFPLLYKYGHHIQCRPQRSIISIFLPQGRTNCPHVIPGRCLSHLNTTRDGDFNCIPGALFSSSLESFSWYLFWVFPAAIYSYFYLSYYLWKQRTDYSFSKCLFYVIQNLSSPLNFLFSQLNNPRLFSLCLQVMFQRHLIFLLSFGLSPISLPVPWSVH